MPACSAFGCSVQSGKGLALFSVPLGKHDKLRRAVWLHRIGRKDFKPTKSSKLCERHFTEDQFEPAILKNYGIKKLKPYAVPSIFPHQPETRPRKAPHPEGAGNTEIAAALPSNGTLHPSAEAVPADGVVANTAETSTALPSNTTLHPSTEAVPDDGVASNTDLR